MTRPTCSSVDSSFKKRIFSSFKKLLFFFFLTPSGVFIRFVSLNLKDSFGTQVLLHLFIEKQTELRERDGSFRGMELRSGGAIFKPRFSESVSSLARNRRM